MSSFWRALSGELYLFSHRRSVRIMHVAVFVLACLLVIISRGSMMAFAAMGDIEPTDIAAWNFWPQWASATRTSLYLVELSIILLVAGALPHEIMSAATRDPLSRRISRSTLVLARTVVAILLPLTMYLCVLIGAGACSYLLFDAGDILEEGQVLMEIEADGVAQAIYSSMWHAVLPLLALGALASACGAIFRRGVVAVGVCFLMVLLPTMLYDDLENKLPFYFADFLPAFGPDSFLERTSQFAAGYSDSYPIEYDDIARIGWVSPLPFIALAVIVAIAFFRRRSL